MFSQKNHNKSINQLHHNKHKSLHHTQSKLAKKRKGRVAVGQGQGSKQWQASLPPKNLSSSQQFILCSCSFICLKFTSSSANLSITWNG
jgi:hypothetical protein